MFDDTKIDILDNPNNKNIIKTIYGDFQEYDKTIKFDEIEISITKRLFCNIENLIYPKPYLLIKNRLYKVIKINEFDDYLECWLYECKNK